jgi:hypothetical protein
MAAKGMLHHETILADGSVANTRVSARILKKWASKCQRIIRDTISGIKMTLF